MLESGEVEDERSLVARFFGDSIAAVFGFLLEVSKIAGLAFVLIVVVRFFIIKPFVVQGGSMEPNFHDKEYLIIDELSYRFREPVRGEPVVFHPPNQPDQFYIKRIIGLPGERVELREGEITIYNLKYPNGIKLNEEYIFEYTSGSANTVLGENEFFVLGDNRDSSLDSRNFGVVPRANIVGKVWLRGLPIDRFGAIKAPVYTY